MDSFFIYREEEKIHIQSARVWLSGPTRTFDRDRNVLTCSPTEVNARSLFTGSA